MNDQKPGWEERARQASEEFEAAVGFTTDNLTQEARRRGRITQPHRPKYWEDYWPTLDEKIGQKKGQIEEDI